MDITRGACACAPVAPAVNLISLAVMTEMPARRGTVARVDWHSSGAASNGGEPGGGSIPKAAISAFCSRRVCHRCGCAGSATRRKQTVIKRELSLLSAEVEI